MPPNQANIITFLRRKYPHPEPDPDWVAECIAALLANGQSSTPAEVEEQYLYSDLGASTRASAGAGFPIPQNDEPRELHDMVLFPTRTLVQVHSLAEVGASAFSLKTTLEQRRDILSGKTRIRRLEDEEEADEGAAVQGEKAPPPYSRSMLVMDVSDGRTALRAMEYRRIAGLALGETSLGIKLILHNVRCLRGTLLLAPDNCTVAGGAIAALAETQASAFIESLEARLEAAKNGTAGGAPAAEPAPATRRRAPRRAPAAAAVAAAAADNDDDDDDDGYDGEEAPPRPRRTRASRANPPAEAPPRRTQASHAGRAQASGAAAAAAAQAPARAGAATTDAARAARLAAIQAALPSSSSAPEPRPSADNDDFDYNLADVTFQDDDDGFDDSFLMQLDDIEAAAVLTQPGRPQARTAPAGRSRRAAADMEIIVVSD